MLAYDQSSFLLSIILSLAETWENAQDIQDKIIPCLRVLKGILKQELSEGKVIVAGAVYDFNGQYLALIMRNDVLEKVKADSIRIEEQAKEIQNKVLQIAVDALERDVVRENHQQQENLKNKIQEKFLVTTELVLKQNLSNNQFLVYMACLLEARIIMGNRLCGVCK